MIRVVVVGALVTMLAIVVPGVPGSATPIVRAWTDPQGAELLTNGSFESGGPSMSPWIFRHDVSATLAAGTVNILGGTRSAAVTIAATSPNPWFVQLRQEHLHLQAGTIYTFRGWGHAPQNRVINARIQSSVAPYPTFVAQDFVVSPYWDHFEMVYTPTRDIPDAFVGFNLAQDTGEVDIDNVSLTASRNLVSDGGFETAAPALGAWTLRNDVNATFARDTATKFDGTASARIAVPKIDGSSWHVQLRQPVGPLWTRATYRVGFAVKATQPRSANVRLQSADSPYPTAIEGNVNVTTTWIRVSFDWTPPVTVTNPFFAFNLGQDAGTVWLDDVTVTQIDGPVGPCVDGIPENVPAMTTLTVPNTTVHAGDVLDAHYDFIHVADRPGATLLYQTPTGAFSALNLNIYDQDQPFGIVVPTDWAPGVYRLQTIDVYALTKSTEFRNHDIVGTQFSFDTPAAEYPLCGHVPLNFQPMDLHVVAS
jgi:hypothetical protein